MKPLIVMGLLLSMGLCMTSGCRSLSRNDGWRNATVLVLGVDTGDVETVEGEALKLFLNTFEPDDRSEYRPAKGTRFGHIVIDGIRYRVTASTENTGNGRTLLTIHSGSSPLHLRQKIR